ncbi:MAG: AAA family ATPase, partial [Chloroflexi bacterium]|nr:AAA family ATPase [Chloroflexota bacterium]
MVVTPFPGQSGPRRRPAREAAPLIEQLRDALAHLHDPAYLHQHPLLSGLAIADGRALRTQLLAAIERLRPETVAPAAERSQRVYQLMRRRYRDGLLVSEVRRDLKISHSEYHREHNRGMAALAALLSQEPPAIASGAHLPAASVGLPPAVIALPPVAAPPKGVRAGGLLSALPGRSPFIGRGPELDLLRRGFDEAAAGLGVRLVLIDGEPGVGKTRLGREAGGYAHAQGGVFLEGRYLREGAGPYAAWVEALRPALRLLPALDLALAVGPFATDLAQILPELPSLLAAFPLMVSKQPAAPAALTPADLRLRLYDGVTELLRSLARHWPVLLLLDDLQWAPDLALLAHVVRRMAGERILLLCAHREEELRGEPLLAQARADLLRVMGAQALALRALDAENTHQLVAAQLGAAPAAQLQSAVFDVTGGNPFFVEETLRGLIEDGAVRRADDGWTLVGAAAVRLSETVRSLLRERVARLGAPAAEALTRASVLGEEFTFTA